jgi:hypothetical protein
MPAPPRPVATMLTEGRLEKRQDATRLAEELRGFLSGIIM